MSFQRPFLVSMKRPDPQQAWGFRVVGGKDQDHPVMILKVAPGSMAEKAGLHKGDEVIQIGHVNVQDMIHDQVQEAIQKCGNRLEMFIIRENLLNKPKEEEPRTVKAVFHSTYNSPMDLYSKENIADTLAQHAEVITDGFDGSDTKPRYAGSVSPLPVIQRSAVLQTLQQEKSKGINYMNGPSTPPVQKKQPPPPPPKPIPPVRSQILKSPPGGKRSPTYYSYLTQQPQISSSSYTSQDISYSGQHVPTYKQQQQFYQTPRPFSPSSYNEPLLHQMTTIPDYYQQKATCQMLDEPQNTTSSRVSQPWYQHTTTSVQRTYQQQTVPSAISYPTEPSYQQSKTPPAATSPIQLSCQQSNTHTVTSSPSQPPCGKTISVLPTAQPTHKQLATDPVTDAHPPQSSNQQPIVTLASTVTDQKTYPQSTTTHAQPNYKQTTIRPITDGVMHVTTPQKTTFSATKAVTHSQYDQPSKMSYSTATVIIHTKVTPSSPTSKDVQKNYQKDVEQSSSPIQTSTPAWRQMQEQIRPSSQTGTTGTSPSPTASPTPPYKVKTSEGNWPPQNPTSKELPKIGFSSGWTKEINHGKTKNWPPQKPEEYKGSVTPTPTSRTGAITSAWNLRPSTPPSRTPPFAGGSPLPGRRNKDLLWPPETIEKQSVKKSSSKPLRKDRTFEECIVQHSSVTLPRTYRPPPDIHQV